MSLLKVLELFHPLHCQAIELAGCICLVVTGGSWYGSLCPVWHIGVVPTSLVLDTIIPSWSCYSSWLYLCVQFDFFTQQGIGQEDLRVSFLVWHSLLIWSCVWWLIYALR